MPAIRNARLSQSQGRHSGRLENRVPIAYDNEGWEVPLGHATLQDLYLTRGDSLRLTTCNSPPPSTTSHSVLSSDLVADPVPEMVAVASNGNTVHVRPRSNSAISASSSTSSSSSVPTPSSTQTDMTRNIRANAKPYSRPGNRIPRPRNAFIIFRSHYNARNRDAPPPSADGTKTNQNEVSKQAAKEWRSMTPEQRKPFQDDAKREKEAHAQLYPDYRYAPNGKKGAPAKPKPKARTTQPASKRKARQLRAEFTDSESEGEDSYSDRSATPVAAAPPARNLRPRAEVPRYISPESSGPERSPSPTSSPVPQSPAASNDEGLSDAEDSWGWVETEDIPTLSLPLPLPVTIKPLTGQGVDPNNLYAPLLVHDDTFPSTKGDLNVEWFPWASMAADALSNSDDPSFPLVESSSSAFTSSLAGGSDNLGTETQFGCEMPYGMIVGTLDDLFSHPSEPDTPPEGGFNMNDYLEFPEDSDSEAAGPSGLGTELPQ